MLHVSGMVLDDASPSVLGHLSKNIRIAVLKTPLVDEDVGVAASIRIVNPQSMKKQDFIKGGTATSQMLDFLSECIRYGISVCVAGATSSGKTTLLGWLLTTIPDGKRKLSISLQGSFTAGITGLGEDIGTVAAGIVQSLQDAATWQEAAISGVFGGIGSISSPIFMIFLLILMGYAVIKVFFANLKRGGILLIQIAVGSLYLFSVPRGYIDGFVGWCKQVIGLCLTAFLQATVLIAGLMFVKDQALLGLGLMLSAGEIPRIAGQFGLETGTKANVMGAVYAAQGAMNLTRTVVQVVSK